ncbi:MAG: hypothetical protein KAS32_26065 [Candidatus Peribacteraceae bacterium]|nr:hypothetical protein [Candidatus Peribacteraceae bacterium]
MAGLREVTPKIITYTLGLTGVENSQAIPNNTVDLQIRLRDTTKVAKVAFVSGESATNFFTLDSLHPFLKFEDVFFNGVTLHCQGTTDSIILELLVCN